MLTQRAWLLGFVAFCFYLIAVVNTLPGFYYVLMWLAIGLLAASLGIAFLSLTGLGFRWKLGVARGHARSPGESEAGRELAVPLVEATLGNQGSLNKTGLIVELLLHDTGRDSDVALGYLLEAVPAGQTLEIALPLRDLPRGIYALREAQLVGSDVLGLFRARRRVALEAGAASEIFIGPALLPPLASSALARGGRNRRGVQRRAQPGGGDELHGTRPYVTGDDLRHIHWKTTARTGELVLREWEQNGRAATLVVWDGALQSEWGSGASSSTECGLILVASLLASFADDALPCALAVLGQQARFCAQNRLRARGAELLENEALEALAQARSGRAEPLNVALRRVWSGAQSYETAVVVTASLAPDVLELVRDLGARNLGVRVILLDGAALGRASGDPRFGGRKTALVPRQNYGGEHEVTAANYQRQAERLQRAGAAVTLFAPSAPSEVWEQLQRALHRALESTGRAAQQTLTGAP